MENVLDRKKDLVHDNNCLTTADVSEKKKVPTGVTSPDFHIYHAWYSAFAAKYVGFCVYRKACLEQEVIVTEINTQFSPSSIWQDLKYMGLVQDPMIRSWEADLEETGLDSEVPSQKAANVSDK
jgi:hypothetical protein